MMGNSQWCIVAIPEEDDPIWQFSSEKIPHLTLLFLGKQNDPELAMDIATQLQHTVATSLNPFMMNVHSRGVLGEDQADVLFFDQAEVPEEVLSFRGSLLKYDAIRKCYDASNQYPSWTPHITVGYPKSPAKSIKNVSGTDKISYVYFDRIALWIADYDGPTFQLPRRRRFDEAVDLPVMAMSDKSRDILMHQKLNPNPLEPTHLKLPTSGNLMRYGSGVMGQSYRNPIQNALGPALQKTRLSTGSISNDVIYLQHAFIKHLEDEIGRRSSSKTSIKYDVSTRPDGIWILSSVNVLEHTGTAETYIQPIKNDHGNIVDYAIIQDDVLQEDLKYALMHHGVKGMKWGRRRKPTADGSGSEDKGGGRATPSRFQAFRQKKQSERQAKKDTKAQVKATAKAAQQTAKATAKAEKQADKKFEKSARFKRPVVKEAAVAEKGRGRIKKHGTDAMSNQQLQTLVTRMNLEQQYTQLRDNEKAAKSRRSGRTYLSDAMKDAGKEFMSEAARTVASEGLKFAFEQAMKQRQEPEPSRAKTTYSWLSQPAIETQQKALPASPFRKAIGM